MHIDNKLALVDAALQSISFTLFVQYVHVFFVEKQCPVLWLMKFTSIANIIFQTADVSSMHLVHLLT